VSYRGSFIALCTLVGPNLGVLDVAATNRGVESTAKYGIFFEERRAGTLMGGVLVGQWHLSAVALLSIDGFCTSEPLTGVDGRLRQQPHHDCNAILQHLDGALRFRRL
jgi:hypothetical protein